MIEFHLREYAGLRRFGYPVRARFNATTPAGKLPLTDGGRSVAARFTHLHFVNMPVQVGAATSPRSMLNPLQVNWV
jgi:hypothetical protein